MSGNLYTWNWGPGKIGRMSGRKGQPCRVLARGSRNSCLIEFFDGAQFITSRNGLRKLSQRPEPRDLQAEPPYPGLEREMVCFSIRFPEWTIHSYFDVCPIQEPHKIEDCLLWRGENEDG
jgi:hypothetical protein